MKEKIKEKAKEKRKRVLRVTRWERVYFASGIICQRWAIIDQIILPLLINI